MKLINKYFELKKSEKKYELGDKLTDISYVKEELSNVKEKIISEYKMILLIDKVDPFSIEAILNTFSEEELITFIQEQGGIEALKTGKKPTVEEVVKPENLNGYEKLVEDLNGLIERALKDEEINLVVANDYDGDGVFSQIAIDEFNYLLKELGIENFNIINIEEENQIGRGVGVSELEHPKLKNINKVDMFLTTDSNFDVKNLQGYKLDNKYDNTQFRVTDHHHTTGKNPCFIDPKKFLEVNPHLTSNSEQAEISGAALISMILKEVVNRQKENSGLYFNTNGVESNFEKIFDKIIYTTNMSDVATNSILLEPNREEYDEAAEYTNLFNTLNIYKRLRIVDKEKLIKQLPIQMKKEDIEELWNELDIQFQLIKIVVDNKYIEEIELHNKFTKGEGEGYSIEDIQEFLKMTTDSFVKEKIGGRHDLMRNILKNFKKTHKKLQKTLYDTNIKLDSVSDENLTIVVYDGMKGYKLLASINPAITESSMGFILRKDNKGNLQEISLVSGRSNLSIEDKTGWEVFGETLIKNTQQYFAKKKGEKLSKSEKEDLRKVFNFKGHGGAFGGFVNVPEIKNKLNISDEEWVEVVGKLLSHSIKEEKLEMKIPSEAIYIEEDNMIDLPNILKVYDRMEGYKSSSNMPNIVIKVPESFEKKDDVYQALQLFSGEAIITAGDLKPGDYIECQVMKGALMVSHKVPESQIDKLRKYNNGKPIKSPHVEMLNNEVNKAKQFKEEVEKEDYLHEFVNTKGVYVTKDKVEVTNNAKISIDLETTGSNAETSEIYNIGIVVNDGKGNVVKYSIFLDKVLPLSSIVLTRMTQKFISEHGSDNDTEIDNVFKKIIDVENKRLKEEGLEPKISAHNGMNFDFRMLEKKMSETYLELMESGKYNLVDTTYIAREAMGEEYGLKIKGTNIRLQNFKNLKELDIVSWLKDYTNKSQKTQKLYNMYSQESYFIIEEGTDNKERLYYYEKGKRKLILKDLSEESIENFINKDLVEEKIPAKFSINLITKLVQIHDIMYKANVDKLKTEHTIEENIFNKVENYENFKKIMKNQLKNYYFTLSKRKNASIMLDKLKNHQMSTEEIDEKYEKDIDLFIEDWNPKTKETETETVKEKINEIIDSDTNIYTVDDLLESEGIQELKSEIEDMESIIIEEIISQSGLSIDNKVIYNEFLENQSFTLEELKEKKVGPFKKQILTWMSSNSTKDLIEILEKETEEENQKITIKEIKEMIENGQIKMSHYYSEEKLEKEFEEELKRMILDIQTDFLENEKNKEKAVITEEISAIVYLISQNYLINVDYDQKTPEEIKIYAKNLSKKTGIPSNLINKTMQYIKEIYTEDIKNAFLDEPHQAVEDSLLENLIMDVFWNRFYPFTERDRKQKILSAGSELVKKTFRKKIRDDKENKGYERLAQKYVDTEQDIYFKLKDNSEMTEENYKEIKEYLDTTELANIVDNKSKTNDLGVDSYTKSVKKILESENVDLQEYVKEKETMIDMSFYNKIFSGDLDMNDITFNKVIEEMTEIEKLSGIKKSKVLKEKGLKAGLSLKKVIEIMEAQILNELIDLGVEDNEIIKDLYKQIYINRAENNEGGDISKEEEIELFTMKKDIELVILEKENLSNVNTEKIKEYKDKILSKYDIEVLNKEHQLITKLRTPIDEKMIEMLEIKEGERNPRKQKIDLKEEKNRNMITKKIEGLLKEIFESGVFDTTNLREVEEQEEKIIEGIEVYLYSIIETMDTAKILNKDNMNYMFKNIKKELVGEKKPVEYKTNDHYFRGSIKATFERSRILLSENLKYSKVEKKEEKEPEKKQNIQNDEI